MGSAKHRKSQIIQSAFGDDSHAPYLPKKIKKTTTTATTTMTNCATTMTNCAIFSSKGLQCRVLILKCRNHNAWLTWWTQWWKAKKKKEDMTAKMKQILLSRRFNHWQKWKWHFVCLFVIWSASTNRIWSHWKIIVTPFGFVFEKYEKKGTVLQNSRQNNKPTVQRMPPFLNVGFWTHRAVQAT